MPKYIIASTRLNDDGTVHSVSHPIEIDSDTINTIKIFDKTYVKQEHGRWISINGWVECSCCHREPPNESNIESDYCPNCGAKMDEVEENDRT